MSRLAALLFLLCSFSLPAAESDYVWANPALESRGVVGDQFQAVGKVDLSECENSGTQAARKAIPVIHAPPGFSDGGWRAAERDRKRDEIAKSRTNECMTAKGWNLQRR